MEVRFGTAEREPLTRYALEQSIPLAEAARRMVRAGLKAQAAENPDDEKEHRALLEELCVSNLVLGEQILMLLETITPRGPGAGDAIIVEASLAAQRRLAKGTGHEIKGSDSGGD